MVTYPKDWDMIELGAKCEVTSSKRVFESEWKNVGIPFLRTRDIASFHTGTEQKDKLFISESTYHEKVKVSGEPCIGDLLVTGVGTIGLPYLVSSVPMYFKDGNILWVKGSESFEPQFLYLLFLANEIKQQIIDGSGFTTVGTFTIKNAKKLRLPCPEKNEQKAIAETLSCIDTHIANLTELIEKKKAIRDGALEDLLSGRTRLVGFCGERSETELIKICKVYDGTHQTPKYTNSGIRFVSVENIKNIYFSEKHISKQDYDRDFSVRPEKNDVLMTRIGDIGTPCIVTTDEPIAFYVSLALFKSIQINSLFLYYYIMGKSFQKELDDRALHHATPKKINKGEIGKCMVRYPVDEHEQEAIASTLLSLDTEITSLEEEKDKMLQIKAGAMDDLLTGRIRLKRQGG